MRNVSASILLISLAACAPQSAPEPPAPAGHPPITAEEGVNFRVYRGDGTGSSMEELVAAAGDVDALLLGEEHTDRINHEVQVQILTRVFQAHGTSGGDLPPDHPPLSTDGEARRPVILSLEMFERDVQSVLDEYLEGFITEEHFLRSSRPWDRYDTDYRGLVEFARIHEIPVVAANAPRRYVNRATRLGKESLEELPAEALLWLPPLPYPDPSEAYLEEWDELMGEAAAHLSGYPLDAQTLWDASMGEAVARALDRTPGALAIHVAGGFHVENGTGIPEAVEYYRPGTRLLLVGARPAEDPLTFPEEYQGIGDFVVVTQDPGESHGSGGGS